MIEFWHSDCVSFLSLAKFTEKYKKFCKKNHYIFSDKDVRKIHAITRENITTMPKNDITKMLVSDAAQHVLQISIRVEKLRSEMIKLAMQLPEFETVLSLYGVGETLAAKLIGEIGDVRRFESKGALAAYAGVDPGKDESGRKISKSGKISRTGDALIRKFAYQVVECHLLTSPADEPVYQFLNKKRSEGKNYYVYMTAACNKFLRIYYGRVKEFMDSLEPVQEPAPEPSDTEMSANVLVKEPISPKTSQRIIVLNLTKNKIAFTCSQGSATQECDTSGLRGLAYTNENETVMLE